MPRPRSRSRRRRLLIASAIAAGAALIPGAAGASAAGTLVSSNWAGYASTLRSGAGTRFSSVSGTWTVPAVSCSARRAAYSAVWVGLGGYRRSSSSLEQTGTEQDCSRSGTPVYLVWYELVPAAPVSVSLPLHAGQQVTASVTVSGHDVTLRLRNLSTGARYSVTRRVGAVDVSSAEWIVEAPSECAGSGCTSLPLADFGTVGFSAASATAAGATRAPGDSAYTSTTIELQQSSIEPSGAGPGAGLLERSLISALPSSLGADGSFTVTWAQHESEAPSGVPTLPGFGA